MVVQHNLQSMNANRQLGIVTGAQAKSTEKLSSGFKINRAADDAAGLSISEKMRRQMRGLDRASTNAQDGVSAVQTAEGALNEVHDMLQRMNELANQASNGTNSLTDRQAIQDEISQLNTEIDRVSETTKFNELYLMKGAPGTKEIKMNGHDAGLKGTLSDTGDTATFTAELTTDMDVQISGKNYHIYDDNDTIQAFQSQVDSADSVTINGTTYLRQASNAPAVDQEAAAAKKVCAAARNVSAATIDGSASTLKGSIATKKGSLATKQASIATKQASTATKQASTATLKASVAVKNASAATKTQSADTKQASADAKLADAQTIRNKGVGLSEASAAVFEASAAILEGSAATLATSAATLKSSAATKTQSAATKAGSVAVKEASVKTLTASAEVLKASVATKEASIATKEASVAAKTECANTRRACADTLNACARILSGEGADAEAVIFNTPDRQYLASELKGMIVDGAKVGINGSQARTAVDIVNNKDNIKMDKALDNMKYALTQANLVGVDDTTKVSVSDAEKKGDNYAFTINKGSVTVANDLAFDLHVGADADMTNKIGVNISTMNSQYLGVQNLQVADDSGIMATYAIDAVEDAIQKVNEQRSALGAVQNRLEHTIKNLDNVVENTTAAESRIRDTDIAEEMVTYSKNNILAQAGQSMLAQANQSTQGALSLLG